VPFVSIQTKIDYLVFKSNQEFFNLSENLIKNFHLNTFNSNYVFVLILQHLHL